MLRFRTSFNVMKRSSVYQFTITRGHQNNRRDYERPDDAKKKQLFDKAQRQDKAAKKSAESVVKQNFFFTNERNMEFAKCMVAYNRVVGAVYFVTVKESKAQFEALYEKAGRKNLNSIRSIGAHSKVEYEVDPADAAKIKLFTNSEKLDRIFYIDPSQEANMIGFLTMCSEMLNEGGQVHMILEASVFQLLNVEELARTVKIFIKEEAKFLEGYCKGFTLTHVNATDAVIYKLELDTSRKTPEIKEGNDADHVTEPMSSLADNHNAVTCVLPPLLVESGSSSEVNPFVGQWNKMYLVCETELKFLSQHVQLQYHESGRSSEVDPTVAKGNMTDLVCTSLEENHVPRETLVLPGSVVDTTNFCHPSEFDLNLSSHAGIQGTGRPIHTLAENKFIADGLQIVTKTSCYMYARSTSSDSIGGIPFASIVRRAYYAHPAAVITMVSVQH